LATTKNRKASPVTVTSVSTARSRARRLGLIAPKGTDLLDIILACREGRCLWDPWSAWYIAKTRYDITCWERRQPCLNGCTSVKVMRVSPDDNMEDWGTWRKRPEQWKAAEVFGLNYGSARRARITKQVQNIGIGTPVEMQ
jgi:hypothetical protein